MINVDYFHVKLGMRISEEMVGVRLLKNVLITLIIND
jgi:hypothetical protein